MIAPDDSALLRAALAATGALDLERLPQEVTQLLVDIGAPPRLGAHLRAVHDVARKLLAAVSVAWPALTFDANAVSFGAATHDIGKALHPNELIGPGSLHEGAGHRLLLERGLSEDRARFARTHSQWAADDATLEDQLVALADKVWKGRREEDLEQRVVARISSMTGSAAWEVFARLDDILQRIAASADARLAFQSSF